MLSGQHLHQVTSPSGVCRCTRRHLSLFLAGSVSSGKVVVVNEPRPFPPQRQCKWLARMNEFLELFVLLRNAAVFLSEEKGRQATLKEH
jgi:hypothetical protein